MDKAKAVAEALRCMALISGNEREWWQEHVEEFRGHIDEGVEWICVPRTVEDVSTPDMLRLVADAWDEAHPDASQEAAGEPESVEPVLGEQTIEKLIGGAVYGVTQAMVASGLTPTEACRMVGFAIMEGSLGRSVTSSLGIPSNTGARWRRDIAAAADAGREVLSDPGLEIGIVNELLPVLGFRDLRVERYRTHG